MDTTKLTNMIVAQSRQGC